MNKKLIIFLIFILFSLSFAKGLKIDLLEKVAGGYNLTYSIENSSVQIKNNTLDAKGSLNSLSGEIFYFLEVDLPQSLSLSSFDLKKINITKLNFNSKKTLISKLDAKIITKTSKNVSLAIKIFPFYSINNAIHFIQKGTIFLKTENDFFFAKAKAKSYSIPLKPFTTYKSKFFVSKKSIYSISYTTLLESGFLVDNIDPATIQIFDSEKEIPIFVDLKNEAIFSKGDRILFYAEGLKGKDKFFDDYSFDKAYFINWGNSIGLRTVLTVGGIGSDTRIFGDSYEFGTLETFIKKEHIEYDNIIIRFSSPEFLNSTNISVIDKDLEFSIKDSWFWGVANKELNEFSFITNSKGATETVINATATIKIGLAGGNTHLHNVELTLNGHKLPSSNFSWSGQKFVEFTTGKFPSEWLSGGLEKLYISLPLNDRVYLNYIDIEYKAKPGIVNSEDQLITPLASFIDTATSFSITIDNTNPNTEVWDLSGRRFINLDRELKKIIIYDSLKGIPEYFIDNNINSINNLSKETYASVKDLSTDADLLVICPEKWHSLLDTYKKRRETQGLKVSIAGLEAIYNQFGEGHANPDAIKDFVSYKYHNTLSVKPKYLLLIGDASEGNNKIDSYKNILPSFYVQIKGWGLASADTRFTTIDGNDLFPDLAVGRIPVRTKDELLVVLKKIENYEKYSDKGEWKNEVLLIAGAEENFSIAHDRLADIMLDRFSVSRVDVFPKSEYCFGSWAPSVIERSFNSGHLFSFFYGHGGGSVWSDYSPDLLNRDGAEKLNNYNSLPFVFSLTCLTASFEAATFGSNTDIWSPLGESMILSKNGGSSAFYGASGHSASDGDNLLEMILANEITDKPTRRAGDIIFSAERKLLAAYGTYFFPIIGQYNLLGDPSMPIIAMEEFDSIRVLNSAAIQGESLKVEIYSKDIKQAQGSAKIFKDNSKQLSYQTFEFNGPRDTIVIPFKANTDIKDGRIIFSLWNSNIELTGRVSFSMGAISVNNEKYYPADFSLGDSISIQANINMASSMFLSGKDTIIRAFDSVILFWLAADENTRFDDDLNRYLDSSGNRILMNFDSSTHTYKTNQNIFINSSFEYKDLLVWNVKAYFGTSSFARSSFNIKKVLGPPDLTFANTNSFKIDFDKNNNIVANVFVLNSGETKAYNVELALYNDSLTEHKLIDSILIDSLDSLKLDTFAFLLKDIKGFNKFSWQIDNSKSVFEKEEDNNTITASFGYWGLSVPSINDTLVALDGAITIRNSIDDSSSMFVYIDCLDSLRLDTPIFKNTEKFKLFYLQQLLTTKNYNIPYFYFTTNKIAIDSSYFLSISYQDSLLENEVATIMVWDSINNFWRALESINSDSNIVSAYIPSNSVFTTSIRTDFTGPSISATSLGKELNYRDFIPLDASIDVVIQDLSPVDKSSLVLMLRDRIPLDTSLYTVSYVGNNGGLNITYKPKKRSGADSLFVFAKDMYNNSSDTIGFPFEVGSSLECRSLSYHPNPFRSSLDIVYTVTDQADIVIKIYTISGRLIKTIERYNTVGYNEVKWDGKDELGRRLANGLYYLKFTVIGTDFNGNKKIIEKIERIVKATENR